MTFIELSDVSRVYKKNNFIYTPLKGVSMVIDKGDFIIISGSSGSGRPALINILSGIESPDGGKLFFDGKPLHELDVRQLAMWRIKNVGILFRDFRLMPELTTLENTILPLEFGRLFTHKERITRAYECLEYVEMKDKALQFPSELSSEEMQRVGIARALANNVPVIIGDDILCNLDDKGSEAVIEILVRLNKAGTTVILGTSESDVSNLPGKKMFIRGGTVINAENKVESTLESGDK